MWYCLNELLPAGASRRENSLACSCVYLPEIEKRSLRSAFEKLLFVILSEAVPPLRDRVEGPACELGLLAFG
jgi:hypothetical protein